MANVQRQILGKNVNWLRQVKGFTQEKLAELASIDRTYLQRIEKGTANPGVDVLRRLKDSLRVSWTDLLGN